MRNTLKFLLALGVAFVVMLAFRGLVMTICTIDGDGLAPHFIAGDRVVVNRWSYGLRTGKNGGLFDYGRICRQDVSKGDCIAFEDSLGRVLICRCSALPGDTVKVRRQGDKETGRQEDRETRSQELALKPEDDAFIKRVVHFVEEHLGDSDISIGDMADAAAVSRSGLQRKLKQLMGVTPIDFLREARIKKACQLLRETDLTIVEIAYKCGFSDAKYFSKSFKASVGKSPTDYKNAL